MASSQDGRPPQPKSILRGHKAQVHTAAFIRGNERLVTGDGDGFVVVWDLAIMRPRAVWQAHNNSILGTAGLGRDRLITHARDNKLIVWNFSADEEKRLSTCLPLDVSPEPRPQPPMLHALKVNTMNFCSFSHCPATPTDKASDAAEILVAVPNTLASEAIDIFHLPSQDLRHTIKLGEKNGMVMALSLFHVDEVLTLVAGYENGMAVMAQLDPKGTWVTRYQAQTHSQPILSLDVSPKLDFFITSGADAIIAKHPIPTTSTSQPTPSPPTTTNPSNADPVGTTPSSPPSAHHPASPSQPNPSKSLLAAALANAAPAPPSLSPSPTLIPEKPILESTPIKKVNTKHAGQQSLRIRSDGAIFATAGWDARVRVYSTKTLAEVAVCKWHEAGCYAVAFADVLASSAEESSPAASGAKGQLEGCGTGEVGSRTRDIVPVVPKLVAVTVSERRMRQARRAHWLAAGSKDGKVSLWDVF